MKIFIGDIGDMKMYYFFFLLKTSKDNRDTISKNYQILGCASLNISILFQVTFLSLHIIG
jgi:hypothetical protein